jgi:hypothetical protein
MRKKTFIILLGLVAFVNQYCKAQNYMIKQLTVLSIDSIAAYYLVKCSTNDNDTLIILSDKYDLGEIVNNKLLSKIKIGNKLDFDIRIAYAIRTNKCDPSVVFLPSKPFYIEKKLVKTDKSLPYFTSSLLGLYYLPPDKSYFTNKHI